MAKIKKEYSLEETNQEIRDLIKAADTYPRRPDEILNKRHWREFPGGFRVCFTRDEAEAEKEMYHLSISNSTRKVKDLEAIAILDLFGVKGEVYETPPYMNPNVRHFLWECNKSLVH
ncbi:Hypothetical protein DPCES_2267 [Desulfitobacterium hafniense]|uniref:Uncharacterized protein n=1 Tax=Desulfitobacterium hafniense TaxID=49338 RepID=A0A098AZT7_DESHA|nr:hypothetical protein [Desulfitobacterium hafniense]CDX02154.1 Hypothetical protein DPCES_2267 [Desulfitobacterium hafniense]